MDKTRPRLLIIDDEERIRRLLVEFLKDFEEFSIRSAGSAEQGLEALAQEKADLCIVDMRLPDMNGEAFIRVAEQRGLCPRFLLHTGSLDMTISSDLKRLGISGRDVFPKPCPGDLILARIREILDREKQ